MSGCRLQSAVSHTLADSIGFLLASFVYEHWSSNRDTFRGRPAAFSQIGTASKSSRDMQGPARSARATKGSGGNLASSNCDKMQQKQRYNELRHGPDLSMTRVLPTTFQNSPKMHFQLDNFLKHTISPLASNTSNADFASHRFFALPHKSTTQSTSLLPAPPCFSFRTTARLGGFAPGSERNSTMLLPDLSLFALRRTAFRWTCASKT